MNASLADLGDFEFILRDMEDNNEPALRAKVQSTREQFEKVKRRIMEWSKAQSPLTADGKVTPGNREENDKLTVLHGIDAMAFVTYANDYYRALKDLRGSLRDSKREIKTRLEAILERVDIDKITLPK